MKILEPIRRSLEKRISLSYLFINDGSTDTTAALLEEWEILPHVRVIHLLHNFGHSAAIACGIEHCEADAVILMDADLQDDPQAIPQMIQKWQDGSKSVVAERTSRAESHRFLFRAFYLLLHKISPSFPQFPFGTFCLLDRSTLEQVRLYRERTRYFPGIVALASPRLDSIPVARQRRAHGGSRVGMWGLIHLALTAFLSFSTAPVRFVSFVGLLCSGGALAGALTIVAVKLFTTLAIPGWASMMTAISFFSGIQLLCLGILGEYVARIYDEVKQRPLYLIAPREEPLVKSHFRSQKAHTSAASF